MSPFMDEGDWVREKDVKAMRSPITKRPCENNVTESDPNRPCPAGRLIDTRICGGGTAMA